MQDVSILLLKLIETLTLKKEDIGRSRGDSITKIHALVDALGYPIKIILTTGQVHDITVAHKLIEELSWKQ